VDGAGCSKQSKKKENRRFCQLLNMPQNSIMKFWWGYLFVHLFSAILVIYIVSMRLLGVANNGNFLE
jgi:hypothetical protein